MKILKISWIVARKVAVHVQLNLKKIAGKILEMGLLKYSFDNKISVTNECNAAHQKILIINCQTFSDIFNFLSLTLDKT